MGVYALRIRRGPENKSCFSGWNCHVKLFFGGLTPNLGPAGSIPPNGGICIENWAGASKQNLLLRVGLPCEILFSGGSPQTWGPQGPLHQMGVFALIILRGPATKSSSSGWVCPVKFYFRGAHPNPGPVGSTPPNRGICADNFAGASKQKLLLGVGFPSKFLFVGGSPQPRAWGVHSTKWGYLRWELRGGQQTKAASRGRFAGKFLFVGGSFQPRACEVHPNKRGYLLLNNFPEIYHALLISPGLNDRLVALPHSRPSPRLAQFFCLSPLDQSARDFFTMILWNSPGQRRGAQLVENINSIIDYPFHDLWLGMLHVH